MSSTSPEFIDIQKSLIVRAGAGAGKTTALTQQVLNFAEAYYLKNKKFPRIMATTFTRKATQELKERIVLLALDKGPQWVEYVHSSGMIKISTIHGILDHFLKTCGSYIGLDPGFEILDSSQALFTAKGIIRELFIQNIENLDFVEIQKEITINKLADLSINYYHAWIQAPDLKPHDFKSLSQKLNLKIEILLKKTKQLCSDIQNSDNDPKSKWYQYADELLKLVTSLKKYVDSNFLDTSWKVELESLPRVMRTAKNQLISEELNEEKKSIEKEYHILASDPAFDPNEYLKIEAVYKKYEVFFKLFSQKYLDFKIQTSQIEMSDLEELALKICREHTELIKAYAENWDYWLVDEYQDTSPIQVELLKYLSGSKPQYVVGDPQQSIYLFRGAHTEVFKSKEKEVLDIGGEHFEKTKNYRSKPELLEFFNEFFSKFNPPFKKMTSKIEESESFNRENIVANFYIDAQDEENLSESTQNTEIHIESKNTNLDNAAHFSNENLAIVEHIQSLYRSGVAFEDICILARTNKILKEISEVLNFYQIPFQLHTAGGFYLRREVQDVLALYKFLVQTHDDLNLITLLRSPWFHIPDFEIAKIIHSNENNLTYWELFKLKFSENKQIQKLILLQNRTRLESLSAILKDICFESGILDSSYYFDPSGRFESNLWKLFYILESEESRPGFNALDFLKRTQWNLLNHVYSDDFSESDAITAMEPKRVHLMTVHASKGLQFQHIIVPKIAKSILSPRQPSFLSEDENLESRDLLSMSKRWSFRTSMGEDDEVQGSIAEIEFQQKQKTNEKLEQARVLYVALTRAKESVFLSWTEPAQKNSWLDLINWNFEEGIHQHEYYSYQVLRHIPKVEKLKLNDLKLEVPRALFTEKNLLTEKINNNLIQKSVTALLQDEQKSVFLNTSNESLEIQKSSLLKTPEVYDDIEKGILTHQFFQSLKYSNPNSNLEMNFEFFLSEMEVSPIQRQKFFEYIKNLSQPPLMELIRTGHVEMGYSYMRDDRIEEGQIDLWGVVGETLWIVDYKTGNYKYRHKAIEQMKFYAEALLNSNYTKNKDFKICLAAVYPFEQKTHIIEYTKNRQ